jgi:uroporphyrinogen-III synthase
MVTRPRHQAETLCKLIEAAGGRALRVPVLELVESDHGGRVDDVIDRLAQFDLAIFISKNAVDYALRRIRSRGASTEHLRLAAVGQKTAEALRTFGLCADIFPRQGYTSEDLLQLKEMQGVRGQNIVIFRGEGGREVLADTLRARGAMVHYVEVYRRTLPVFDRQTLRGYFEGGRLDLVTITSGEGLRNLITMCGPPTPVQLHELPLLVGSQRLLEEAREIGFRSVLSARDPSDESMFQAVSDWARRGRRDKN